MKRLILACSAAAALSLAIAVPASVAGADGKATPFKASYFDSGWLANANCSGAHVVQSHGTIKDSEECTLSNLTVPLTAGTQVGNPTFCTPAFGCNSVWSSDYNGALAKNVTITLTNNGDGTWTEDTVAYY